MKQDGGLFWAYEYGSTFGIPPSEVLKLPIIEYQQGFIAYLETKNELIEKHASKYA